MNTEGGNTCPQQTAMAEYDGKGVDGRACRRGNGFVVGPSCSNRPLAAIGFFRQAGLGCQMHCRLAFMHVCEAIFVGPAPRFSNLSKYTVHHIAMRA